MAIIYSEANGTKTIFKPSVVLVFVFATWCLKNDRVIDYLEKKSLTPEECLSLHSLKLRFSWI